MRRAATVVAFPLIVGGWVAAIGCSARPEPDTVIASAVASAAAPDQDGRKKGEEASCCARHFPGNRRLRELCLSDAAHHQGLCAPRCPPPRDGGSAPDAGRVDGGPTRDGGATDGPAPGDAAGEPSCPMATPITAARKYVGKYVGWSVTVDAGAGQTVTWTASGTSGFVLLEASGPEVDVECQGVGTVALTATIAGPGSCALSETVPLPCEAACGNGILEPGEQCDPPDGASCNNQCQFGATATCGDGTLEDGEDCDRVSSVFCLNCRYNSCYGCVAGATFTQLCSTTTGAHKIACQSLAECMFSSGCSASFATLCFCATGDCAAGATGPCGPQLQGYLGTTDPAQVSAAIQSPDVTQLMNAVAAGYPCHALCAGAVPAPR